MMVEMSKLIKENGPSVKDLKNFVEYWEDRLNEKFNYAERQDLM